MPEQTAAEPQVGQPQVNMPEKKKSKKWLWALLAFIVVVLVGMGIWLLLRNPPQPPSEQPQKQTTPSAKPTPEMKKERTKVAYEDGGNIWVLDVVTREKMQITKDAGEDVHYRDPGAVEEDSFTYLRCASYLECKELWRVDVTEGQFKTKQIKKFNNFIRTYDIESNLKYIVYLESPSQVNKLRLFNFNSSEDKVVYETTIYGYGFSQDDALYTKLSPDGSKFLIVDTRGSDKNIISSSYIIKTAATGFEGSRKIVIWDIKGNNLADISGFITEPVWKQDSSGIFYRDIKKGIFSYDIETKNTEKLSNETDWSSLAVSPDGKKLAHNKGYSMVDASSKPNSKVYLFDIQTKRDTLLGNSLVRPNWVNDDCIVSNKLRKCTAVDTCLIGGGFTYKKVIVVTDINSGATYEVKTKGVPTVFDQLL